MTNHGVTMAYNRDEASFIRVRVVSTTVVSGHAFKANANRWPTPIDGRFDSVHTPTCHTTRPRD